MAYQVAELAEGRVIEVELSGKLSKQTYEEFVPLTEARIKQFGKVRLLVIMHDFHGWEAGALWEDIKFDAAHFNDIERLALVGDRKWEQGMAAFCKPFTTAEIKYFELDEIEQARRWITADD
jgi:hypothetical protein